MDTNAQTPEQARAKRQASIDKARHKALEQHRAGNWPTLLRQDNDVHETRQRWTVGSRTTAGQTYLVDLNASAAGIATHCSCPASEAERICWHRSIVRACCLGELDYHDGRRPALVVSLADLHGRPSAGLVLVDEAGNGTQPDPWPLDDVTAYAAAV